MESIHKKLGKCHPSLKKGELKCTTCGRESKVDSSECLAKGWPKCCGYTMQLQ